MLKYDVEKPKPVAYSGISGAYTEEALFAMFGRDTPTLPLCSFSAVFEAISSGRADYGVVPVENSSTGFIAASTDLLGRYGLYITGEYVLNVNHCLAAPPDANLDDIREVYSHEQALLQCANFLDALPNICRISFYNTAASARFVAESMDSTKAAVSSAHAAKAYGLQILASDIQSEQGNQTRFVSVGKNLRNDPLCNKASIFFSVRHESGSLVRVLTALADTNFNMTKLESRPVPGSGFEYCFYMDFICGDGLDTVRDLLEKIAKNCLSVRLLGYYPAQKA